MKSRLWLKKISIIHIVKFFFILFFSAACTNHSILSSLTKEERKDLEYFFRYLMIHGQGSYVLFGSKPLCQKSFSLSQELSRMNNHRRDLKKGWEVWEKIKKDVDGRRFVLTHYSETIALQWPDQRIDERIVHLFTIADVKKTALVLARNYTLFKSLTGVDFHPMEIVYELENPDSEFWSKILFSSLEQTPDPILRHQAMGLLYGFSEENALLFSWREEAKQKGGKMAELFARSESLEFEDTRLYFAPLIREWVEMLPLPGYVSFDEGQRLSQYESEKKKIQKICQGKDFLSVILKELSK